MAMNRFHELARKMHAVHHFWQAGVADLTLEQVNHHERAGVLPISFTLLHYVKGEDNHASERLSDKEPLWVTDGWAKRIGASLPDASRGTPMEASESLRFADLDAWRAYQAAVFEQTEHLLMATEDGRWDEVIFDRVPAGFHGGFLQLLVGDDPVSLGDYLEAVLFQHGVRHLGELEHARGIVGLGGLS
jgi:hypothetical protein